MQLLSHDNQIPPDHADKAATIDCARAILDGVPPVMWFIRCQMRRHRTAGLSVPQFRTLVLLQRYPTASLSMVADHLGSSLPSASRMVSGLVGKKLVQRKTSTDDRRQMSLELTKKGRDILHTAREATTSLVAKQVERLSREKQLQIIAGVQLLRELFHHEYGSPVDCVAVRGTNADVLQVSSSSDETVAKVTKSKKVPATE